MTRTRLLAGVAAAGLAASTMVMAAAGPAAADYTSHPSCVLLHLQVREQGGPDIVHFCI